MRRYYSSGLIGLDVKPRRKCRIPKNRSSRNSFGMWIIPAVVTVATLGLCLLTWAR